MHTTVRQQHNCTIIDLHGAPSSPLEPSAITAQVEKILSSGAHRIALVYPDHVLPTSPIVAMLFWCAQRVHAEGHKLILVHNNPPVDRIIEEYDMAEMVTIVRYENDLIRLTSHQESLGNLQRSRSRENRCGQSCSRVRA